MFKRKKNYHQTPDIKPCKECAHYKTDYSDCEFCDFTNSFRPFERKKKKTGVQTPEFRKPSAPPPPPTSGSNAVKPSYNCGHHPTCTSTQNPPDTFSSLLKATSVQILPNNISTVTYVCTYETPCGWCTKWDKKCDKKIPERGQRVNINPVDDAIDETIGIIVNKICASESDHEWECVGMSTGGSTYRCRKCYTHKTIPLKTEILETYIGD